MIAMQYKIILPDDFDMNIIRERVIKNGKKTDGFKDLIFKAYIISEKDNVGKCSNEYSPLYLWKSNGGMNEFIFDGFYDNILDSFGWQNINIGIPFACELKENFKNSKYLLEVEKEIKPMLQMKKMHFSVNPDNCMGKILIYNPDKWKYVEFDLLTSAHQHFNTGKLYKILHLST